MSVQEHESEYPALQRGRQCINTSISAQASPFPVRGIWSPTFHFFGRINWMSFSYRRTRQCFISTKAAAPKQSILPTSQWVYDKISSIFYPVSFNYSIADSIKLKRVIVKKNENNTFEVDSITSHHFLHWDEYKILSEEVKERLVTYYSCPVSNCICKPKTLLFHCNCLNESSEEQIDKIWRLSLLENAHRLKVIGDVETLSQMSYLSRIKQQFPKLEILFDFNSRRYDIKWKRNSQIHINSRLITLVTKGEERIFHIRGDNQWFVF